MVSPRRSDQRLSRDHFNQSNKRKKGQTLHLRGPQFINIDFVVRLSHFCFVYIFFLSRLRWNWKIEAMKHALKIFFVQYCSYFTFTKVRFSRADFRNKNRVFMAFSSVSNFSVLLIYFFVLSLYFSVRFYFTSLFDLHYHPPLVGFKFWTQRLQGVYAIL